MAQRISRAKQTIRQAGARFTTSRRTPSGQGPAPRASLHALYLMFNEGYNDERGSVAPPRRSHLGGDPARAPAPPARPQEGEAAGAPLALMLLSRCPARGAHHRRRRELVPLADQDRALWDRGDRSRRAWGSSRARSAGARSGPTSCRRRSRGDPRRGARGADETDLAADPLALYDACSSRSHPAPSVTLNRAVAVAMVDGPRAGLAVLGTLDADDRTANTHRLEAVRGHLLELASEPTSPDACASVPARAATADREACPNSATSRCAPPWRALGDLLLLRRRRAGEARGDRAGRDQPGRRPPPRRSPTRQEHRPEDTRPRCGSIARRRSKGPDRARSS